MCICVCRIGKFINVRISAKLQKDQYMHNNQNSKTKIEKKKRESSQKESEHITHCLQRFKGEKHE